MAGQLGRNWVESYYCSIFLSAEMSTGSVTAGRRVVSCLCGYEEDQSGAADGGSLQMNFKPRLMFSCCLALGSSLRGCSLLTSRLLISVFVYCLKSLFSFLNPSISVHFSSFIRGVSLLIPLSEHTLYVLMWFRKSISFCYDTFLNSDRKWSKVVLSVIKLWFCT